MIINSAIVSGDINGNNIAVGPIPLDRATGVSIQVAGTFTGTVAFQVSLDGTTFSNVVANSSGSADATAVTAATAAGLFSTTPWRLAGYRWFRCVGMSWGSGTANVTLYPTNNNIIVR